MTGMEQVLQSMTFEFFASGRHKIAFSQLLEHPDALCLTSALNLKHRSFPCSYPG